jgi:iron complex outermembrane receptor protein
MKLLLIFPLASTLLAAQQGSLEGVVTGADGKPVSGISVETQPGSYRTESGTDGAFRFDAIPAGSYLLTATGRGYLPLQQEAATGSNVKLELQTVQTAVDIRERIDDFLATSSVSVSKSPESLMNIPYAIQVLPKALFDDRAAQDIKSLYRNIGGVTDSAYSAMTFRGFTQREVLFNGVRGNPYGSLENDINDAGFSTSQGRLTNIEFVEVLKGPAAVLFGAGEAGGVINFVTKKPRQAHSAEATFRVGSFAQKGGTLDVSGPLARTLFYRAAWFQEDRRTFRYNARNENAHLATGLSWRKSESTSVAFDYEYIDQTLPGQRLRGIPIAAAGAFLTSREWNAAEPSDSSALQARVFQTRLDHAFTPTLRTDVTFRFLNSDRPELYHEPRGINADGRTMRREFRNQFRGNNDYSLTANGYQRVSANATGAHNFVFGYEAVRQNWQGRYGTAREQARGGPVPDIDMLQPVYGLTNGGLYFIAPTAFTSQRIDSTRHGFFLQDQITVHPRLQVLLGGRVERLRDEGTAPAPLLFTATAVTGRAGAVYRVAPRLSLFGSVSNSFNRAPALAQTPLANGPHDPETGIQIEGGAKAELANQRVLLTVTLYRIRKNNVLRPDPAFGPNGDNFAAVLPVGRVVNQGFEVDFTGRVTRDWSVIANYSFLDSNIASDRFTPSAVGKPMPNAVRHAFGLHTRYEIRKTGTAFTVGSEARGRFEEPYAGTRASGYAIWDVGVFQRVHRNVELRGTLENVADRTYGTALLFAARAGIMPGAPRTATFSIRILIPGNN